MRIALAIAVWIAILGGLLAYTQVRDRLKNAQEAPAVQQIAKAPGRFVVELTPGYDIPAAVTNEFALDAKATQPGLFVRVNAVDLYSTTEALQAGIAIEVPIEDTQASILVGDNNEVYVAAAAPPAQAADSDFGLPAENQTTKLPIRGVRVRVLRDGTPVADKTLWSGEGESVSGTLSLHVEGKASHEHTHAE